MHTASNLKRDYVACNYICIFLVTKSYADSLSSILKIITANSTGQVLGVTTNRLSCMNFLNLMQSYYNMTYFR